MNTDNVYKTHDCYKLWESRNGTQVSDVGGSGYKYLTQVLAISPSDNMKLSTGYNHSNNSSHFTVALFSIQPFDCVFTVPLRQFASPQFEIIKRSQNDATVSVCLKNLLGHLSSRHVAH